MAKSKYTRRDYTIEEAAYVAGLMDGVGTFFIGNYGANPEAFFQIYIKISSTDKCMIEWVYNTFGGAMREYHSTQMEKKGKGPVYIWCCSGDRLTHLCEIMIPYLVAKKEQAEILLEIRKTYQGAQHVKGKFGVQRVPKEVCNTRTELMKRLQSLHCRNQKVPK